jgi:hypothetical protein
MWQVPFWHEDVAKYEEQTVPHAPQLWKSLLVSTHLPLQFVIPLGQPHWPAVQTPPVGHADPHAPQFAALVCVSTQAPLQLVVPAGH